jgi:hypothetical protein
MHSVLFTGELPVSLSGPIANPTTRHLHPCFAARSGRRSLHTGLCQCERTYPKNLSILSTKESGLRRPLFSRVAVPVSALACAWSRTGVPEPPDLRACQIMPYGTTTPHFTCCKCRPNMNPSGIRRHQCLVWNAEFRMSDNWCGRRRVDLVSAYAVAYRPSTLNYLAPRP